MGVVYLALGFVGAQTSMEDGVYGNGGQILASVVYRLLGTGGNAVLGLAVLLACLTTSIGLATSLFGLFSRNISQAVLQSDFDQRVRIQFCYF